jgi:hypothetical protein
MKDKFATLGINSFTDLEEACNDVDVLEALQTSLPIMAFSKFRKAVQKSSRLDSSKMMMFTTVSRSSVISPGKSETIASPRVKSDASPRTFTMDEISLMIDEAKSRLDRTTDDTEKKELEAKLKKYSELSHYIAEHTAKTIRETTEKSRLSKKLLQTKHRMKSLEGMI